MKVVEEEERFGSREYAPWLEFWADTKWVSWRTTGGMLFLGGLVGGLLTAMRIGMVWMGLGAGGDLVAKSEEVHPLLLEHAALVSAIYTSEEGEASLSNVI
ncbi:hypothetical protein FQA39_LY16012 [Lamprigera yunnana]|nr:hypothetical protein FQA39_LY16012 [Lamprigera yunnana]